MTAEEFRCHLIRTYLNTKKERRPVRGGPGLLGSFWGEQRDGGGSPITRAV